MTRRAASRSSITADSRAASALGQLGHADVALGMPKHAIASRSTGHAGMRPHLRPAAGRAQACLRPKTIDRRNGVDTRDRGWRLSRRAAERAGDRAAGEYDYASHWDPADAPSQIPTIHAIAGYPPGARVTLTGWF
jgi:hypothetical protein